MIQRIQTVYLAVAALLTLAVLFAPFASGKLEASPFFNDGVYTSTDFLPLTALIVLTAVGLTIAIFRFSNRHVQLRLCLICILESALILVVAAFALFGQLPAAADTHGISVGIGTFLPLVSMAATYLAMRGIRADERLVRSMDRLR